MPKTTELTPQIPSQNALSNLMPGDGELPDTISAWAERYFATEVTTGERSRKEQARDFRLFIGFLRTEIGSEERLSWTPRVSREFVDYLRSQIHEDGSRRFADRTVNRVIAHLKTFAKWVNSRSPRRGQPARSRTRPDRGGTPSDARCRRPPPGDRRAFP